nr:hypothetical protein Itr_chr07CG07230 [Ipomoea trifida]
MVVPPTEQPGGPAPGGNGGGDEALVSVWIEREEVCAIHPASDEWMQEMILYKNTGIPRTTRRGHAKWGWCGVLLQGAVCYCRSFRTSTGDSKLRKYRQWRTQPANHANGLPPEGVSSVRYRLQTTKYQI